MKTTHLFMYCEHCEHYAFLLDLKGRNEGQASFSLSTPRPLYKWGTQQSIILNLQNKFNIFPTNFKFKTSNHSQGLQRFLAYTVCKKES